jgi:hypothetical protein
METADSSPPAEISRVATWLQLLGAERPAMWFAQVKAVFNTDLQASVAELVYGEPLRIPGELLTPTADPVKTMHLITQLSQHMAHLRPVPAARHVFPATFVHNDLHKCMHVFLRHDTTRRAL